MKARGADFSSAQPPGVVAKIAGELDFALVKATQGTDYVNPYLGKQLAELQAKHVLVGYYHYLDAGIDGARQWDHFEAAIAKLPAGPVVLDFEEKGTTIDQARTFIRRGRQRGYRVGLYGSESICKRRLGQSWRWVAKWSQTPPGIFWEVWQWTDGDGRQDLNVYRADKHHLARWWALQSKRKQRHRLRWWLHDGTTAQGPYRLAGLIAALTRYLATHPKTRRLGLERK